MSTPGGLSSATSRNKFSTTRKSSKSGNRRSNSKNTSHLTSKMAATVSKFIGTKPPKVHVEKTLIKYIDWKNSYHYKHLIVRHAEDCHKWENSELMNDDESEFLMKLIRNAKLKKTGV